MNEPKTDYIPDKFRRVSTRKTTGTVTLRYTPKKPRYYNISTKAERR